MNIVKRVRFFDENNRLIDCGLVSALIVCWRRRLCWQSGTQKYNTYKEKKSMYTSQIFQNIQDGVSILYTKLFTPKMQAQNAFHLNILDRVTLVLKHLSFISLQPPYPQWHCPPPFLLFYIPLSLVPTYQKFKSVASHNPFQVSQSWKKLPQLGSISTVHKKRLVVFCCRFAK